MEMATEAQELQILDDLNTPLNLSVVTMTHNRRDTKRLRNLLSSLREQVIIAREIILVDTSENEDWYVENICSEYATFYYHSPQKEFNKSRALNYGIKYAQGHYVMCVDIDMMFAPSFLLKVWELLSPPKENPFVLAQCGYLFDIPDSNGVWNWLNLKDKVDPDRLTKKHSPGAVQVAKREWFWKVRGYDERYIGLGGMDNDMIDRAHRDGLDVQWIEFEDEQCYHQPHEISAMKGQSSHLFLQEKSIVRNPDEWGEL